MTNYAVFLEGNDFELSRNGSKEVLGFFVTVRVESQSEQEAASRAIEIVKADPQLEEAFRADTSKWNAPGFTDTLFRWMMQPEVFHGKASIQSRVQA